jgi:hypothetical protein
MPPFTNRTAGATCQALPHRPVELLLYRPWDLLRPVFLRPAQTLPGPCPSGLPGPHSTGWLYHLNDRPPLPEPWGPTTTRGLQT